MSGDQRPNHIVTRRKMARIFSHCTQNKAPGSS
jgi:hypothetical protein